MTSLSGGPATTVPRSRGRLPLRPGVWIALILVVIVAAGAGLLSFLLEPVEDVIRTRPEPAVRSNPLYAAAELFRVLGLAVEQHRGVTTLPPPDHVLIYLPESVSGLTPGEAADLLDWAWSNRGHLITGPDPVLVEALGAAVTETGEIGFELVEIRIEGSQEHAVAVHRQRTLDPLDSDPWLRAAMPEGAPAGGDVLLSYLDPLRGGDAREWRGGLVTVLSDLSPFTNESIGEHDHAAFAWQLVNTLPAEGVWLVREGIRPTLLLVVARRGWPALVSLTALLLAGWLRGARPFGPPVVDPPAPRRSLREHLLASGRFLWRQGWGAGLLARTRDAALREAAANHPAWARMSFRQRCHLLAERTGIPAKAVAQALQSPHPEPGRGEAASPVDAPSFLRTVEILETIRRSV